jgi:hypothetical protein
VGISRFEGKGGVDSANCLYKEYSSEC